MYAAEISNLLSGMNCEVQGYRVAFYLRLYFSLPVGDIETRLGCWIGFVDDGRFPGSSVGVAIRWARFSLVLLQSSFESPHSSKPPKGIC